MVRFSTDSLLISTVFKDLSRVFEEFLKDFGSGDLITEEEYDLMIEAFEIRKAFLPEDHEDIGESVRRLAMHFLEASEDPKTALPFAEKAVRICEIHDPDNADGKLAPAVNVSIHHKQPGRCL